MSGDNRRRQHLVGVRMNDLEYATLRAATTLTGMSAPALLRDTFLMANNHALLPDLVGTRHDQEVASGD